MLSFIIIRKLKDSFKIPCFLQWSQPLEYWSPVFYLEHKGADINTKHPFIDQN